MSGEATNFIAMMQARLRGLTQQTPSSQRAEPSSPACAAPPASDDSEWSVYEDDDAPDDTRGHDASSTVVGDALTTSGTLADSEDSRFDGIFEACQGLSSGPQPSVSYSSVVGCDGTTPAVPVLPSLAALMSRHRIPGKGQRRTRIGRKNRYAGWLEADEIDAVLEWLSKNRHVDPTVVLSTNVEDVTKDAQLALGIPGERMPRLVPDRIQRWRASKCAPLDPSSYEYIQQVFVTLLRQGSPDNWLGGFDGCHGVTGKSRALNWAKIVDIMCAENAAIGTWATNQPKSVVMHYFRQRYWRFVHQTRT